MLDRLFAAALFLCVSLLAGCSGEPSTGPVALKWDRDQCERCRMVVSDPYHAAQVRQPAGEGRSKVYRFDDFGCAVIWLEQQPWKDDPGVEIWVTDHRNREWVDARQAIFLTGQVTPMEYGLGAQDTGADNGMSFSQARDHVYKIDQRSNAHHQHRPAAADSGAGSPPADKR